jgi:hypothetical protein
MEGRLEVKGCNRVGKNEQILEAREVPWKSRF